jgi:hypothetical protein
MRGWDILIGHPPCTFLALCQIWRKHPSAVDCKKLGLRADDTAWRPAQREKAVAFFRRLWELPIDKICLENPMSIASTRIAPKSQTIHPWEFGHMEQKTTWLWLKNLPALKSTNNVYEEMMKLPRRERESGFILCLLAQTGAARGTKLTKASRRQWPINGVDMWDLPTIKHLNKRACNRPDLQWLTEDWNYTGDENIGVHLRHGSSLLTTFIPPGPRAKRFLSRAKVLTQLQLNSFGPKWAANSTCL